MEKLNGSESGSENMSILEPKDQGDNSRWKQSYQRGWSDASTPSYESLMIDPLSPKNIHDSGDGKSNDSFCRVTRWLSWWGLVIVYFYIAVILGWRIDRTLKEADTNYDVAGSVGGALTCLTIPLAVYLMVLHLLNFVEPKQQSQIVRIIFMVPVYSFTAFISLQHPKWALPITTVRECYEAYVIYCFLQFLICQIELGEEGRNHEGGMVGGTLKTGTFAKHKPPFCCLQPWGVGPQFLHKCKQGVLQYVFIRVASTALAIYLQITQPPEEKENVNITSMVVTGIVFCSQMWALYVLLLFYNATHKEMSHVHPMGKFLAIKSVVFFSWWQGILVEILEHKGHISDIGQYPANHVSQGIQDLLICAEMLIAAVAFFFAFPLSDFVQKLQSQPTGLPRSRFNTVSGVPGELYGGSNSITALGHPIKVKSHSNLHRLSTQSYPYSPVDPITNTNRVPTSFAYAIWATAVPIELHADFQLAFIRICERLRLSSKWHALTKRKVESRQRIVGNNAFKNSLIITL